jgi:F0F1-type ATP synthase assembly protein I
MSSPRHTGDGTESRGDDHVVSTLLATLADTTWRMFTPVILCTGLGLWGDIKLHTKPWLTFIGVAIGFALAIWLIRAQLQKIAALEEKSNKN